MVNRCRLYAFFLWRSICRVMGNFTIKCTFNPRLTGVSAERHWPGGGGTALQFFSLKVIFQVKVWSKVKIEHFRILVLRNATPAQTESMDQSQGQVTKGHYIQKSHSGHVIHVLWPILAIELDGYVSGVVWCHLWKFSAKVRSKRSKRSNFRIYKCG